MQGFPGPVPSAATSPSLGVLLGYAGSPFHLPSGPLQPGRYAPPLLPTPGPTALGPGSAQGSLGTGVAGVGLMPVTAAPPPALPGGPHPLPPLPACPLPQGFPNPFATGQLGPAQPGTGPAPGSPGTVTVTGPMGYLPGLGTFGPPRS